MTMKESTPACLSALMCAPTSSGVPASVKASTWRSVTSGSSGA